MGQIRRVVELIAVIVFSKIWCNEKWHVGWGLRSHIVLVLRLCEGEIAVGRSGRTRSVTRVLCAILLLSTARARKVFCFRSIHPSINSRRI